MQVEIPMGMHGRVKQITQTILNNNGEKSDVVYYRYSPKGGLFEAVRTLYESSKPSKTQYFDHLLRSVSDLNRLRFYNDGIKALTTNEHSKIDIIKWMEAHEFLNREMPIQLNKYDQKIRLINDQHFPSRYKNRFDGDVLIERSEYRGNDLVSDECFDKKGNLLCKRKYEDLKMLNHRKRLRNNYIKLKEIFEYDEKDNLIRKEVISYSLKIEAGSIYTGDYKQVISSKYIGEYKYKYDKNGNWIKQFLCSNNKEILLRQREIKYYQTFNGKSDSEQETLENEDYLRFLEYCKLRMMVESEELFSSRGLSIRMQEYNEKRASKGTPDVNSKFLGKDYLYGKTIKTRIEKKRAVFFWLYNYYPFNKEKILEREKAEARRVVWDFKDGVGVYTVAINLFFALFHANIPLDNTCLVIIPASTTNKTERRFKLFCNKISDLLHIQNSYAAITTETHSPTKGQFGGDKTSFFTFHPELYKGKNVILFDDVITSGTTLGQVARELHKTGALRIIGLFLAKTID